MPRFKALKFTTIGLKLSYFCKKKLVGVGALLFSPWLNFHELQNTSCASSVDILYTVQSSFQLLCHIESKDTFEFAFVQNFFLYKKAFILFTFIFIPLSSNAFFHRDFTSFYYHRLAQDHLHTALPFQLPLRCR